MGGVGWHRTDVFCSQSGFRFDHQNLPVKNTDLIFLGALSPSLPNSTKEEGEHCWGISRKYISIVTPAFFTLRHECWEALHILWEIFEHVVIGKGTSLLFCQISLNT